MLIRFVFLLISVFSALVAGNTKENVSPFDLEDEVRAQLEVCRSTIRGAIFEGYNKIDASVSDVFRYRDVVLNTARIEIQQAYESLTLELTTLKELALSANKNIDVCLEDLEPALHLLPQNITDSLMKCLAYSNEEVTIINNNARYYVGTLINEVHVYEFYIDLCEGDLLCIAPIVQRIELALVEVPLKIDLEIQNANELCESLKVEVEDCTKSKSAQFAFEGGSLVAGITTCVEGIIF